MSDDISDIAAFYDQGVEVEDARLSEHQLEYDLTWRYFAHYLPSAGSILEIGAGTGRYTRELCRRGYAVTAVDLSAALLERCQHRLEASGLPGQVQCVVADARDLSAETEQPVSSPCIHITTPKVCHRVNPKIKLALPRFRAKRTVGEEGILEEVSGIWSRDPCSLGAAAGRVLVRLSLGWGGQRIWLPNSRKRH